MYPSNKDEMNQFAHYNYSFVTNLNAIQRKIRFFNPNLVIDNSNNIFREVNKQNLAGSLREFKACYRDFFIGKRYFMNSGVER